MLLLLLTVCGLAIGLVFAYPVSRVRITEASAIQLDQAALAGKADPEQAVVTPGDLGDGWSEGNPKLTSFGILGGSFCGEGVEVPTALSPVKSAVLVNPSTKATVISQAVRADRWQSAREYVSSVDRAVSSCDRFYVAGPEGRQLQRVIDNTGSKPIDDYSSRVYLADDGKSSVTWSTFAVGDVIVAVEYIAPTRPPEGFLGELESKLLLRLAPEAFSPGGVVPDSTTTTAPTGPASNSTTTVLEGGSADESGGG